MTLCKHSMCKVSKHWYCSRLVTRPHLMPDPKTDPEGYKAAMTALRERIGLRPENIPTTTRVTKREARQMRRKERLQSLTN
jgi:hypothetical protein